MARNLKKKLSRLLQSKRKASYTVEAAFIYPIIISVMVLVISVCIDLYQDVDDIAAKMVTATDMDFRTIYRIEEIGEEIIKKNFTKE